VVRRGGRPGLWCKVFVAHAAAMRQLARRCVRQLAARRRPRGSNLCRIGAAPAPRGSSRSSSPAWAAHLAGLAVAQGFRFFNVLGRIARLLLPLILFQYLPVLRRVLALLLACGFGAFLGGHLIPLGLFGRRRRGRCYRLAESVEHLAKGANGGVGRAAGDAACRLCAAPVDLPAG